MGEENETPSIVGLMERAWAARREDRLDDAHRLLVEAVSFARKAGAQRELIAALGKLGHVELDLGNADAGLALYEEAVTISRDAGDPLALAHAVRHVGDIHRRAGRRQLAETCYDEALTLYRSHNQAPPLDYANAIRPMAILKGDAGLIEDAKQLWEEARNLYRAVNVQEGVAECSSQLAALGARPG